VISTAIPPGGATELRARLRQPDDALPDASIGAVPILWNNVDLDDLRHGTDAETILDEIARTGYEGCQLGLGFPEGDAFREALDARGLRLAEVYASLPATVDGPTEGALDVARARLRLLHAARGDVLVVALDLSPGRVEIAGRFTEAGGPELSESGWASLGDVLMALSREAAALGHPVAFHQHAGTFIETPAELDRLAGLVDPALMGLCLDVGHYLVGGGDPVAALEQFGDRVSHVHLKDVDPFVLASLRSGALAGFRQALRRRLFTELGAGVLDLDGVLAALEKRDYRGWLMVEQDSSWGPPSESAAIGRRVLAVELRRLGSDGAIMEMTPR
jgi:inosose dehydratase